MAKQKTSSKTPSATSPTTTSLLSPNKFSQLPTLHISTNENDSGSSTLLHGENSNIPNSSTFFTNIPKAQVHTNVFSINPITAPTKSNEWDLLSNNSLLTNENNLIPLKQLVYKCDLCTYSCISPSDLATHSKSHVEKPYKCDVCSYSCSQSGNLANHRRIHFGDKPFRCDLCPYSTTQSGNLANHKRTHTGEKPFRCDLCQYATTQSGNLANHKKTHTGEKPWKCDKCPYAAIQKGNLDAHKRTHENNEKGLGSLNRYKCKTCDFATKLKGDLIAHEKIHAVIPLPLEGIGLQIPLLSSFACDLCSFAQSKNSEELEEHKKIMHGSTETIEM